MNRLVSIRKLATSNMRLYLDREDAGLGDTAPTPDQVTQFHTFTRQAKALAVAGDIGGAEIAFQQANAIFITMGSPPVYSDDLDFARATVYGGSGSSGAGGSGALADAVAGDKLLRAGVANARPDSVVAAGASGFLDGLKNGVSDLAQGKWFFGQDPFASIKTALNDPFNLRTPTPYILAGGALLALRWFKVL